MQGALHPPAIPLRAVRDLAGRRHQALNVVKQRAAFMKTAGGRSHFPPKSRECAARTIFFSKEPITGTLSYHAPFPADLALHDILFPELCPVPSRPCHLGDGTPRLYGHTRPFRRDYAGDSLCVFRPYRREKGKRAYLETGHGTEFLERRDAALSLHAYLFPVLCGHSLSRWHTHPQRRGAGQHNRLGSYVRHAPGTPADCRPAPGLCRGGHSPSSRSVRPLPPARAAHGHERRVLGSLLPVRAESILRPAGNQR